MNSRKLWSLLLLTALSFSIAHDYTLTLLDKKHHSSQIQHSVQEYLSTVITSDTHTDKFIHDIHNEYHTVDLCPTKKLLLSNTKKIKNSFKNSKVFLSWNYFNFLKPPIV
ncbi:MAG: hypothetical protein OQK48_07910 [Sulfurimonas sp.]|uniref:hypothetical protein n=1 Tax=Sulfurimonas sp. TaxID=2022749 RepID=UPI0026250511|nr:hypothetical protein [Sulfurimonas sp.]MCW8895181.1 hypothetical protein [Sulfurimonas sp.]MCW8954858.1 hypothetical protein [Sulfurimonas sp.]